MVAHGRLSPVRAARVATLVVFGSVTGCAAIFGFDDFVAGTSAPADGGDGGDTGDAPAGVQADVYVSPTGDDSADGTRAHPVKTLRQALVLAGREPAGTADAPKRVAMCAGDYLEKPTTIQGEIVVSGGYDCSGWARPPTNPNSFGPSFESGTHILNAEGGDQLIALGIGHPQLDGLTLIGTEVPFALVVFAGKEVDAASASLAHATLVDVAIVNATVPSPANGIDPQTFAAGFINADTRVDRCSFTVQQTLEASGAASPSGSALGLDQGTTVIRRSLFQVDKIPGVAHGIAINSETNVTVEDSLITVTNALGTSTSGAMTGILALGGTVTSRRNVFQFDSPRTIDGSDAHVVGLLAIDGVSLDSEADRVVGPGKVTAPALAFQGFQGVGVRRVVNASIVLDAQLYALTDSAGIRIDGPSHAVLAHNSMYLSAPAADAGTRMRGLYLTDAVTADGPDGGSALTVENNLVVTDDPTMRFLRASCNAPPFARLANNRVAGFAVNAGGPGCAGAIDDVAPDAGGGNVAFTCPTPNCGATFQSVSGATIILDGLRPASAACNRGLEVPRTAAATSDGTGRARGETTTAGAYTLDCN